MKPAKDASISYSVLYGDSVPQEVGLEISLSYHDWCRMREKAWCRKLFEFLGNPGILKSIGDSSEGQHSAETVVTDIEFYHPPGLFSKKARIDEMRDRVLSTLMK